MLENEEIARIRVKEALQHGVNAQKHQRGLLRRRRPTLPAVLLFLFLAVLWLASGFGF
jgi:hypothetical protein